MRLELVHGTLHGGNPLLRIPKTEKLRTYGRGTRVTRHRWEALSEPIGRFNAAYLLSEADREGGGQNRGGTPRCPVRRVLPARKFLRGDQGHADPYLHRRSLIPSAEPGSPSLTRTHAAVASQIPNGTALVNPPEIAYLRDFSQGSALKNVNKRETPALNTGRGYPSIREGAFCPTHLG